MIDPMDTATIIALAESGTAQIDIAWLFGVIGAAGMSIAGAVAWLLHREDRNLREVLKSIDGINENVTTATRLSQEMISVVRNLADSVSELTHRQSLMEKVLAQLMRMQGQGCGTDGCPLSDALLSKKKEEP